VAKLKIDRSFIADIPADSDSAALTSAIITVARALGLKIIAEGVELREQIDFLLDSGCDHIQGFFVARPLPASQMSAFVADRHPQVQTAAAC
jgi:EAL domain-containing protein (putative c-di-GMP-specific phosphodiesterase class I)